MDESHLDKAVPHQKIKRIGHGYRNFTNYRLRLLVTCGKIPITKSPTTVTLRPHTTPT